MLYSSNPERALCYAVETAASTSYRYSVETLDVIRYLGVLLLGVAQGDRVQEILVSSYVPNGIKASYFIDNPLHKSVRRSIEKTLASSPSSSSNDFKPSSNVLNTLEGVLKCLLCPSVNSWDAGLEVVSSLKHEGSALGPIVGLFYGAIFGYSRLKATCIVNTSEIPGYYFILQMATTFSAFADRQHNEKRDNSANIIRMMELYEALHPVVMQIVKKIQQSSSSSSDDIEGRYQRTEEITQDLSRLWNNAAAAFVSLYKQKVFKSVYRKSTRIIQMCRVCPKLHLLQWL